MGGRRAVTIMTMSANTIPYGYVKSVLKNGVGRYVCQLQRLNFKFCKSSASSRVVRDFIESHLLEFTHENPGVVVYLNPRRNQHPKITAEYLNGRKEVLEVENFDKETLCKWIGHFRNHSGIQIVRLKHHWHTDNPSIQGIWTPATNRDTSWNVTQFPSEKVSLREPKEPSATERLLEMARQLRLQELNSEDGSEGKAKTETSEG